MDESRAMSETMIQVDGLTKIFPLPQGKELVAVDNVTFEVHAGEVYGLLGPNGAGKTTTLRMLLGLLSPTRGEARIGGFSSTRSPDEVKRRVGLVAANAGVYQWLSAREMLMCFADLYGMPQREARVELEKLAELLDFTELLDRRCGALSTGQKQRVQLARALIHRPPVMLLDEPTLGLDVIATQVVTGYISYLRSQGKAVIISTHYLDEAQRLCDRFGLVHRGRLVVEGTLAELRERTGVDSLVEMFLQLAASKSSSAPAAAEETHVESLR
jgi:ABC-2 type transport system ATP-binding protein/sodium transport system ATP-binding protein